MNNSKALIKTFEEDIFDIKTTEVYIPPKVKHFPPGISQTCQILYMDGLVLQRLIRFVAC